MRRSRLFATIFVMLLVVAMAVIFVACDNTNDKVLMSTITFDSNGGSMVSDITLNNGSKVIPPDNPTKPGYDFAGWYSNAELTIPYEFANMPAGGAKLYAKWSLKAKPKSTIEFESNGGSDVDSITAENGANIERPSDPVRQGYRFMGWYTDIELKDAFTFSTMPANDKGSTKLYAKWSKLYTITFYSNEGSAVEPIVEIRGGAVTKPADPTRYGYNFDAWYTDDGVFTNKFAFDTMPMGDINLFAKWTPKKSNLFIDFANGDPEEFLEATYSKDMPVILPDPVKDGYTLQGYFDKNGNQYYDADGEGVIKWDKEGDHTLYAKWTANEYTVTLNDGEGMGGSNTVTATYDEDMPTITLPSRIGYDFVGYYDAETEGVMYYDEIGASTKTFDKTANTTLYARWQAKEYTVTLNANGGTLTTDVSKYTYGVGATLPTDATKTGYELAGWYADETFSGEAISSIGTTDTGNKTYYAKWTAITYSIRYNKNNPLATGEMQDSVFTYDSESVLKDSEFVLYGYTFKGWAESITGAVKYTTESLNLGIANLTTTKGDVINLYAVWEINPPPPVG